MNKDEGRPQPRLELAKASSQVVAGLDPFSELVGSMDDVQATLSCVLSNGNPSLSGTGRGLESAEPEGEAESRLQVPQIRCGALIIGAWGCFE